MGAGNGNGQVIEKSLCFLLFVVKTAQTFNTHAVFFPREKTLVYLISLKLSTNDVHRP